MSWKWILAVWMALSWSASGALVRTLDGREIEGEIRFDSKGQMMVTSGGRTVEVALSSILHAYFRGPPPVAVKKEEAAKAPPRWTGRDIGPVGKGGAALLANGRLVIQGSGQDIGGMADAFHFAYQSLSGDGEISARLTGVDTHQRPVKAGLMLRSNIDPSSAQAMVAFNPASGVQFEARARAGGPTVQRGPGLGNLALPFHVKLKRQGKRFTGFYSEDGQNWHLLGEAELEMPANVLAGAAVCSRSNVALCTATMEKLALSGPGAEPESASAPDARPRARGILFRDGSFLAGGNPRVTDESTIRINRDREYTFPAGQVATVYLSERTAELEERIAGLSRGGVLINNGDFFEGTVREADHGRVRVSSVLFGLRQFEQWRAAAVCFAPARGAARRYEVRLNDGSVLMVDELAFDKDRLVIGLPTEQSVRVWHGDVMEIHAGKARFVELSGMKPAAVEGPKLGLAPFHAVNATLSGEALMLAGERVEHGVTIAAGASVTYGLEGKFKSLSMRLGVPDGILPAAGVVLVVKADGKELLRTASMTSLDEPVSFTGDISGVGRLTFGVETEEPAIAGAGLFAAAVLVK